MSTMTKEEAAAQIDGNEYREEVSREFAAKLKAAGLVAVYGASDDLMEFEGAIYDEFGAYGGGQAFVNAKGRALEAPLKDGTAIRALWCAEGALGPCWTFETEIPHATFNIVEDGETFCRGIVFALADVPLRSAAA